MSIEPTSIERAAALPVDHFPYLDDADRARLFELPPRGLGAAAAAPGVALGATLYVPGDDPHIATKLRRTLEIGAIAAVICLEDAVRIDRTTAAERNVVAVLREAYDGTTPLPPLIFVRPRTPEQLTALARSLGSAVLRFTGVCFPKFDSDNGPQWLDAVDRIADDSGHRLRIMPILEGARALYPESRVQELLGVRSLLLPRREQVAAVRVGGTDMCGLLGLRRRSDETIYDLGPVRDAIVDMVGVFTRNDEFVVSGPVWEYFHTDARLWKPQLRESLFDVTERATLRSGLIRRHLDGLIREVLADRANGLVGKTVIHPSHIRAVNALHAVAHEEWVDAMAILTDPDNGGVAASAFSNKMNEAGPHRLWARRVVTRGEIFGVLREGTTFVALLDS